MGKGVNKLRYSYYYGNVFFTFITSILGVIISILYILFDGINGILFDLNFYLSFLLIFLITFVTGMFSLKLVFAIKKKEVFEGGYYCMVAALSINIGVRILYVSNLLFLEILGIIVCLMPVIFIIYLSEKLNKIKIYPNRCYIGKKEFFYENLKLIKIDSGEINLKEINDETGKDAEILTPITYEYEGKDFSIYYYYILIETEEKIYIAQSISYRNNMVQNLRNAFYESWRWDGSTEMPENWKTPDYRSKGLI